MENYDSTKYSKVVCGAWIALTDYVKETNLGWEIDQALPVLIDGTDHTKNLQAMNSKNNRSKTDDFQKYYTSVTSSDISNIESIKEVEVNKDSISKLKKLYPNNPYLRNTQNRGYYGT